MKYIISESQLPLFLKKRFSHEELQTLLNDVKKLLDDNMTDEDAIYYGVRELIKSKKLPEIDEFGDDESYWFSYLKYEKPLVAFVKSKLGLE
jgi:hypothetical protein